MSKYHFILHSWFAPITIAWLLFFLYALLPAKIISAQNPTQTIQGRIFDNFTETPLPGVNIIVIKDSLQTGTITNAEGEFAIKDLPIGKYTIKATLLVTKISYRITLT
ncbi:MAG: carboxypeptidase-like regulatory domain-containing protein [Draconibacterium sp.]|nr:carboxypeptidase-like regulatory domain-containing protein [Draconibacterium sp.]